VRETCTRFHTTLIFQGTRDRSVKTGKRHVVSERIPAKTKADLVDNRGMFWVDSEKGPGLQRCTSSFSARLIFHQRSPRHALCTPTP